jgi:hypothetical protein
VYVCSGMCAGCVCLYVHVCVYVCVLQWNSCVEWSVYVHVHVRCVLSTLLSAPQYAKLCSKHITAFVYADLFWSLQLIWHVCKRLPQSFNCFRTMT